MWVIFSGIGSGICPECGPCTQRVRMRADRRNGTAAQARCVGWISARRGDGMDTSRTGVGEYWDARLWKTPDKLQVMEATRTPLRQIQGEVKFCRDRQWRTCARGDSGRIVEIDEAAHLLDALSADLKAWLAAREGVAAAHRRMREDASDAQSRAASSGSSTPRARRSGRRKSWIEQVRTEYPRNPDCISELEKRGPGWHHHG